ncbi:MAG: hypothetical protein U0Q15_12745 [Kineosporiaceae bacterium]
MHIDCDSCVARGRGCGDCVVALLLGAPGGEGRPSASFRADFDDAEAGALAVLAGSGLVPPVRMTPAERGAGKGRPGIVEEPRAAG